MRLKEVTSLQAKDGTVRFAFIKPLDDYTGGRRHYLVSIRDSRLDSTIAQRVRIGAEAAMRFIHRFGTERNGY